MIGSNALAALVRLAEHIEDLDELVQAAIASDGDALRELLTNCGGPYTKLNTLIRELGGAVQDDEDAAAALAAEMERAWKEACEEALNDRRERGKL